jgi:hypothetical protein
MSIKFCGTCGRELHDYSASLGNTLCDGCFKDEMEGVNDHDPPDGWSDEGGRYCFGYSEAVFMLPDGDRIHVTTEPTPGVIVGADWDRLDVIALIAEGRPEAAGPIASKRGYSLAVEKPDQSGFYFIKTEAK